MSIQLSNQLKLQAFATHLRNAICFLIAVTLISSCSSDDFVLMNDRLTEPASSGISGYVTSHAEISTLDNGPAAGITVLLGIEGRVNLAVANGSDFGNSQTFLMTMTDSNGFYEFLELPPVQNWAIGIQTEHEILSAMDDSPDGDDAESGVNGLIFVSLDENEIDTDNNFIISSE